MSLRRNFIILVLVLSACSEADEVTASASAAAQLCSDGEVFVEEAGECLLAPPPAPSTSSTTAIVADESSTTTTTVFNGEVPVELTWAAEGTVEADIERAFWLALRAGREIYEESILDPEYEPFVSTHTGREFERIQEDVVSSIADGEFFRYPEASGTLINSIVPVTNSEALLRVCELDRGEYYINGELDDDRDFDSEFQARFVLIDGEWLWEERIRVTFGPLEGERPSCFENSAA